MKTFIRFAILSCLFVFSASSMNAQVNGQNVTFIKFGNASGFLGTYIQKSGKTWVEEGKQQGVSNFTFKETHRDEWSVYLVDASRGVNIQLDLHTKKVMYSDRNNPTSRELYNIIEQYSGVNGWTAMSAKFVTSDNNRGFFAHTSGKTWEETNRRNPNTKFTFQEVGRDEWSVYLHDASRGVNIQLDLHRKKVVYSDANTAAFDLYDITQSN